MPLLCFLLLVLAITQPVPAGAYDVSASRASVSDLTGPQFKDFANEWAFAASVPMMGPIRDLEPWKTWVDISHDIRAVRLAPFSGQKEESGTRARSLRLNEYSWLAHPRLARGEASTLFVENIHAGLGLPGRVHAGIHYGRSLNANLQVAAIDVSYPFLTPSLSSPGLWARFAYAVPSRMPGVKMQIPTLGLYITNEFLRMPIARRPLTASAHGGIQQAIVFMQPQHLLAPGGALRKANTFPASTQFHLGIDFTRRRWTFSADAGYASSESNFDVSGSSKTHRVRAFWNQSYRVTYRWAP